MAGRELYDFGEFTLDVDERRLTRRGSPIALAPKAYDLLVNLIRNSGRLVLKQELLAAVWPESSVEEGILAVHISQIRKALGDGGYIETVSRAGYRWICGVGMLPMLPVRAAEVYELFGRGRAHLLAASGPESLKAATAFEAAIAADPTYAEAHAGLALASCAQAEFLVVPHSEAYARARTAALTALNLNSECADAHVALGIVLFLGDWNWVDAERSLRRALELNPHHTEAYLVCGRLLEAVGKLDDGLQFKLKALERDPLSPLVHVQIAMSYWHQRRYDKSLEWASKALELDPHHAVAREHVAGFYWKQGDYDRHMAESLRHAEECGAPADVTEAFRRAYAEGGRAAVVHLTIERLSAGGDSGRAIHLALLYGESGEFDAAFHQLERAIVERDPWLVNLAVAPQWDCIRADRRFAGCLARMGLREPALDG